MHSSTARLLLTLLLASPASVMCAAVDKVQVDSHVETRQVGLVGEGPAQGLGAGWDVDWEDSTLHEPRDSVATHFGGSAYDLTFNTSDLQHAQDGLDEDTIRT